MLKKFAVTNFKSFKDRIELDLSRHKSYEFNDFAIQNGIIKDGIIYGPNGSGKSNFGYAVFDIVGHLSQNTFNRRVYENSTFACNPNTLMKFEYTFDFNGQNVEYSYTENSKVQLVDESLYVDGVQIFSKNKDGLEIRKDEFPMTEETVSALASNANSIPIVNYLVSSYPLDSDHYLNSLKRFVDSMLWFRCLEDRGFIGLQNHVTNIDEFVIDNNLMDDLSLFLTEVSGQKYTFSRPMKGEKLLFCIIDGNRIPFASIMSTGTSSLYLLYYWLKNLDSALFVFIDEFDAFYHYRLSLSVCKKLFEREKTQVLLTSHNTYLMTNDLLRPDCNFILNNNEIKALCDCTEKELRWGHNIEKMYRGGAFDL